MDIADILDGGGDEEEPEDERLSLWLEPPPGYLRLPVENAAVAIQDGLDRAADLVPPEQRAFTDAVAGTLATMLTALEERGGAYCGLGWHTDEDGTVVGSTLVVSIQAFPKRSNPRVLLKDLLVAAAEADEKGQADLVDLGDRPVLFLERVSTLPRPHIPGEPPPEPRDAGVYQLRAMVPSDDGTKVAVIEFSTPEVASGPLFRAMVVMLAHTVSFTRPAPERQSTKVTGPSIADALQGLWRPPALAEPTAWREEPRPADAPEPPRHRHDTSGDRLGVLYRL